MPSENKKSIDSLPLWKYFLITIPLYSILFYGVSFILHMDKSLKEVVINAVLLSIIFRLIYKGLILWNEAWKNK